jgi:hypothetical protein
MHCLIARAPVIVIVIVGAAVFATGACAGNAAVPDAFWLTHDGGRTGTAVTVNRG